MRVLRSGRVCRQAARGNVISTRGVRQQGGFSQEISVFVALKVLLRVGGTSGRWQKTLEREENEVTLSEMVCLHHQNVPLSQECHTKGTNIKFVQ